MVLQNGKMTNRTKTFFLSDFHFGLEFNDDSSNDREIRVVNFLNSIKDEAKRIILLGDIFDFWFEYKRVVPKGFVLFQGKIKELVLSGIEVFYFIGNHDLWQKDYFEKELGVKVIRTKIAEFCFEDKVFVLGHGDGLNPKDIGYKIMDKIFSSHLSWKIFSFFPSSFALWVAHLCSFNNRTKHRKYDLQDLDITEPMYNFCVKYLKQRKVDYFIFGHRHIEKEFSLEEGAKYINTGCWLDNSPFVEFDGQILSLKKF